MKPSPFHDRAAAPDPTGSTSGVGEATARTLAEKGVKVVVNGRRPGEAESVVSEISTAGRTARLVMGDQSRNGNAERVAQAARQTFRGIDIRVEHAGSYPAMAWSKEAADVFGRIRRDQQRLQPRHRTTLMRV